MVVPLKEMSYELKLADLTFSSHILKREDFVGRDRLVRNHKLLCGCGRECQGH